MLCVPCCEGDIMIALIDCFFACLGEWHRGALGRFDGGLNGLVFVVGGREGGRGGLVVD